MSTQLLVLLLDCSGLYAAAIDLGKAAILMIVYVRFSTLIIISKLEDKGQVLTS